MAKKVFNYKNLEFRDLGFGTQVDGQSQRMLNPDGTFNVIRKGIGGQGIVNLYHSLITMSWRRFVTFLLLYYFIANLFFATIYMIVGIHNLAGDMGETPVQEFWNAFFFSSQTITTVGYGHIHPIGVHANIVAAVESLTGLLGFAMATGLLYGRFSRPMAKVLFSDDAIIAPYKEINAFMFRIANVRRNQLIDTTVVINFSIVKEHNSEKQRIFGRLALEREKINFFPTSWTIVHPIDSESPLYGLTETDFEKGNAEFLVLINAFDDTFSQQVHTRRSYKYSEMKWGARFKTMLGTPTKGMSVLLLDKIGDIERANLNPIFSEDINEPDHMAINISN